MFGFSIEDLSALVTRMEGVARSMSESVERMEAVVDRINPVTGPITLQTAIHLDGEKIADVIQRHGDDGDARV